MEKKTRTAFMRGLGVRDLGELPGTTPQQRAMLREGLRDWPAPLYPGVPRPLTVAGGAESPRPLLANLLWRLVRCRDEGWGRTARGVFYRFAAAALREAGFRSSGAAFTRSRDMLRDPQFLLLLKLITRFVGHDRLCDYEAMGFVDPRPDLRRIGAARPEVVVLFEKFGFEEEAQAFSSVFGVTVYTSGGMPRLASTEWLAKDLLRRGVRRVQVATVADWDPGGETAGTTLVAHFRRYGLEVDGTPRPVVTPERFTARELRFLSYELTSMDPRRLGHIRAWLERTGGIGGEARGIHADHLRPLARLLEAFREVMGW